MPRWSTRPASAPRRQAFCSPHTRAEAWQADRILAGLLEYQLGERTVTAEPGDVCFVPPGVQHQLASPGGFVYQAIKFRAPLADVKIGLIWISVTAVDAQLTSLADEVFGCTKTLPWTMDCGYLGALLYLMGRHAPGGDRGSATRVVDPIEETMAYARNHLGHSLSVSELTDRVHMSVPHFSRRFRALAGRPPGQWIREQRLSKAAEMLRYGDMAISLIAHELGYPDLSTFSKAFHRWQGVSPSAYREALCQRGKGGNRRL